MEMDTSSPQGLICHTTADWYSRLGRFTVSKALLARWTMQKGLESQSGCTIPEPHAMAVALLAAPGMSWLIQSFLSPK